MIEKYIVRVEWIDEGLCGAIDLQVTARSFDGAARKAKADAFIQWANRGCFLSDLHVVLIQKAQP